MSRPALLERLSWLRGFNRRRNAESRSSAQAVDQGQPSSPPQCPRIERRDDMYAPPTEDVKLSRPEPGTTTAPISISSTCSGPASWSDSNTGDDMAIAFERLHYRSTREGNIPPPLQLEPEPSLATVAEPVDIPQPSREVELTNEALHEAARQSMEEMDLRMSLIRKYGRANRSHSHVSAFADTPATERSSTPSTTKGAGSEFSPTRHLPSVVHQDSTAWNAGGGGGYSEWCCPAPSAARSPSACSEHEGWFGESPSALLGVGERIAFPYRGHATVGASGDVLDDRFEEDSDLIFELDE